MRWKYETVEEESKRLSEWHDWFAWYPVWSYGDGVWLRVIKRRAKVFQLPYEQETIYWEYKI